MQFRLKFCVVLVLGGVAHRYIRDCCCSELLLLLIVLWADMSTLLGDWMLGSWVYIGSHTLNLLRVVFDDVRVRVCASLKKTSIILQSTVNIAICKCLVETNSSAYTATYCLLLA